MAHPNWRAGRPSKGDRHKFAIRRLAAPQTDAVLREAHARGLGYGEYIAAVVCRAHGFDVPMPACTSPMLADAPTHREHPKLSTRIPRAAAEVVVAEAEARDLAYTAYLAVVVCRAHGFDAELPERVRPLPQQEVLDISA